MTKMNINRKMKFCLDIQIRPPACKLLISSIMMGLYDFVWTPTSLSLYLLEVSERVNVYSTRRLIAVFNHLGRLWISVDEYIITGTLLHTLVSTCNNAGLGKMFKLCSENSSQMWKNDSLRRILLFFVWIIRCADKEDAFNIFQENL